MSDFVQTMKDWRRMCDAYTTDDAARCCQGCPMDNGRGCGAIYEDDNADPEVIEREVIQWAAEHPEPVYETWFEYLLRIGVIPESAPAGGEYQWIVESIKHNHIPADIAKKLGIEPKEG